MIISNLASRLLRPFANAGAKATIPLSQTDATRASYEQGFPALNMTPIAAGGVPPSGQDFNGILYDLSNAVMWQQAAGILPWSAEFAQSPVSGGYPKNALVVHNAVLYQSSVDNNTETPGAGTNWQGYAPLASPALTGTPTAPTASQFDNSTTLATTAFVQQTIGNLRPFQVITASGTLAASSVGRIVQLAAASKLTITMPKANTVPSGSALTFITSGTESATLVVQSGDTLAFLSRPELVPGESITLVSNGVNSWWRAAGSESEAPPGTVIYVARNSHPFGYLKANGAAISRSTYSRLFAEIGTTFGAGNGSTTFNLPDLRGEFIRGWDDGRGADAGRTLGSNQADAFRSHSHTVNLRVNGAAPDQSLHDVLKNDSGAGLQTTAVGGSETRPRNVALLTCIKY